MSANAPANAVPMWQSRWVASMPAASAASICARNSVSTASGWAWSRAARAAPPHVVVVINEAARLRRAGERPPAIVLPLAGQRQMNAEIELRVGGGHLGDLAEPGTGHHHRARGDEALAGDGPESGIGAMAHTDVVDVRYDEFLCRLIRVFCGCLCHHRGARCVGSLWQIYRRAEEARTLSIDKVLESDS